MTEQNENDIILLIIQAASDGEVRVTPEKYERVLQLIHQRDGELVSKLETAKRSLDEQAREILLHAGLTYGEGNAWNKALGHAIQLVQQQGVTPTEDNCICHCHGFEIDTCFNKTKCKYRKCKHCTPTEESGTRKSEATSHIEPYCSYHRGTHRIPTEEESR